MGQARTKPILKQRGQTSSLDFLELRNDVHVIVDSEYVDQKNAKRITPDQTSINAFAIDSDAKTGGAGMPMRFRRNGAAMLCPDRTPHAAGCSRFRGSLCQCREPYQ